MLHVLTWWWGDKYPEHYVRRLRRGFAKYLSEPHRFVVVTDAALDGIETTIIKDPGLLQYPGCLARLRMFDEVWQRDIGIIPGDRAVVADLDAIVTGPLDPLFLRPEPFLILQDANVSNPCPYNGSLWMLRGGYRPDVWDDFTLRRLAEIPHHEFPDDQGWVAHMMPGEAGWKAGAQSGVYAFHKRGWESGDALPNGARMVVFPGRRDPAQFTHLPWVQEHWNDARAA